MPVPSHPLLVEPVSCFALLIDHFHFHEFFSGIYENLDAKPTCIQWTPTSEHHIIVGNQLGDLVLVDSRKPKENLSIMETSPSGKSVTRIKFSPSKKDQFVVCSEWHTLRVFELDLENCAIKPAM